MQVVFASNNAGKTREVATHLAGLGIELLSQGQLAIESIEETGLSFVENAILKARHASQLAGLPAIADDSGIEVDALQGAPGVQSARYGGPDADDSMNNARLLKALDNTPDSERTARDRKSTRLNSSHVAISYAVFCLKKKKTVKPTLPSFFSMQRTTMP